MTEIRLAMSPAARLLAGLVLLLAAAFCAVAARAAPVTLTDIAGRTVTLDKPATRLLIDDGRYLVALSLVMDDPVSVLAAWPRDINRIGPETYREFVRRFPALETVARASSSAGAFSVEQALAAAPDLAVFSLQSKPSDAELAQLEAAGVRYVLIDFFVKPLQNLVPSLRVLAAATGHVEKAERFIAFRQQRLDLVAGRLGNDVSERPLVFLEPHAARTEECCPSPGRGNVGDYIALAGGDNIGAHTIPGATGTLSLEYVIEADPAVYIATGGPHMEGTQGLLIGPGYDRETVERTLAGVAARQGIAGLSAVREGRVHGLAHQLLNSPLDILTVEVLARWIRPDLFADLDPEATRRTLNETYLAVPLTGINWIDLERR
jgi:iron complex transport system substrate-binding protein